MMLEQLDNQNQKKMNFNLNLIPYKNDLKNRS